MKRRGDNPDARRRSRPPKLKQQQQQQQQQQEARRRRAEGATLKELAKSYNVGAATISRLVAKDHMKIRRALIIIGLALVSVASNAAQFTPDEAMIARIAHRFKATLDKSGISGVGQDVLNCYDNTLRNKDAAKGCVVYDLAALMLDRQMGQIFVARGMRASPSPLYTNEAFDARSRAYGFPAFEGNESEQKKVAAAARRVLSKMFP